VARIHTPVLAAVAAVGLVLAAGAPGAAAQGGLEFETVDADGDGRVTFAEVQAVAPDASRERIEDFDENGDDALDRDESRTVDWL